MLSRHVTENHFHQYINPERDSHPDALAVHGLTTEFLSDKPKFAEIAQAFCDYIRGAELIIHSPVRYRFSECRTARLGMPKVEEIAECITDSLVKARDMFPGRRNSLDALCERFEISNAHRTLHGALLDSELLAEVYLAMTRGQETLEIGGMSIEEEEAAAKAAPLSNIHIVVLAATEEELARHEEVLDDIEKSNKGAPCVWRTEPVTADGALEAEPAK